ncbi:hypothetical protein KQH40_00785 [bacterium]|nr:hypothetical protein [bacterium]
MLNKIVQILRPAPNAGRLLFTSWTEKEALSDLAKFSETLNCQAVIVSRDSAVSRAAADLGMVSVTGDFLSSVEGSHHQFSLVVVPGENISPNPNDPGFTEWQHVLNAGSYLRSQGIMAFVVNQKRFGNNLQKVVNLLQAYRDLRVFRLQADILLVIGIRRGTRSNSDPERFHTIAEAIKGKDLIDLPDDRIYDLPDMRTHKQVWFRSKFFDPSLMEKIAAGLPWGEKTLKTAMTGWKLPPLEPVLPLRAMHLGAAISSGALGSLRVTSTANGDHYVVRGRTLRRIRQSYSREEDAASESGLFSGHKAEKDQQTGDFVTDISLINLSQASIQHVNPQSPKEMHAFLEEFGAPLAKSAAVNYTPLYDPRDKPYQDVLNPELVRVIDAPLNWTAGKVVNISGTEVPSLTNRQRHFTAASFLKLMGKDAVTPDLRHAYPDTPGRLIISGQTAVGKTMISHRLQLGLQLVRARKEGRKLGDGNWPLSMFVGTPANIPHIFSELRVSAPLFDTREVRSRKDLLQVLDDVPHNPRPIMMVISRTMLRQMQQIEPAFNFGIPRFETDRHGNVTPNLKCPTCGSKINIGRKDAKNWPDASFLCANPRVRSRGRKCSHCNSPLFQETHHGKYNLALTLRRELKKRPIKLLSLVIDEVHEGAPRSVCV